MVTFQKFDVILMTCYYIKVFFLILYFNDESVFNQTVGM